MTYLAILTALITSIAVAAPAAAAEDYPNRAITWVVPFGAGGVTDNTARIVAKAMSKITGQPVLVDNRPGAGGIVGTEYVASSKPDGYTILYASSGPMAVNPTLYKGKLTYDPLKSFTPVQALSQANMLIVVNPDAPFKTLPELIEFAKKNPGKLNFGSPGQGTAQHLSAELLQAEAGIKMTHVPYKTGATQMTDLMSGVLDLSIEYPAVVRPYIEAGKMRAIAMTGAKRFKGFPDVPSIAELGYSNAQNAGWSTIAVPAGTPPDIVKKLASVVWEALKDPSVVQYYDANDNMPLGDLGSDKTRDFIAKETEKFRTVVERSGATAE
ncbi:tripartite tricarboxylate transporter substrate binding protein [Bradyrhizobium sp. LHD-71]|uniref:Bug family tripartite tricarboxylate transporter substrate binding protein n=1 Tax=Bradyrhizobium sp. LHD-71 TaxID=3072141 RepID=UPI00280EA273|nr:tripartite tricarboxylate transporter substrate binding protein [Bradyrhizobium sp. LHD-71]MDQ8730759.1 tripartite tricarboxylate transporter substrate binding protein [Bradyrhizobium sp. LHD-71]